MTAGSLGEALHEIVIETLQEPIRWTKVTQELSSELRGQNVSVLSVGPARAAGSLIREMNKHGVNVLENAEIKSWQDSMSGTRSDDVAIVGFASRMPESETLEEIWKVLEDGRDTHKKVGTCHCLNF